MVHLHWSGVTVHDFFESLGMNLTDQCLTLDTGEEYCSDETNTLKLYANNERVESITSYLWEDLDRVLITYGSGSEVADQLPLVGDEACIYSEICPERGTPPTESCVGGLGSSCDGV